MDLFEVKPGIDTLGDKPRSATGMELRAYLEWLAVRRGVYVPHGAGYGAGGIYTPDGKTLILEMPGYGQTGTITMDTLDEAGEVIRTSVIGLDTHASRAGYLRIDAKAVRAVVGPVAKPPKARKTKRGDLSPVERVEVAAAPSQPETPAPTPAARPIMDGGAVSMDASPAMMDGTLADRVAALEAVIARMGLAIGGGEPAARPKRTEAQRLAILRAWRMRGQLREERQLAHHLALQLDAARVGLLQERDRADAHRGEADRLERERAALAGQVHSLRLNRLESGRRADRLARVAINMRRRVSRADQDAARARADLDGARAEGRAHLRKLERLEEALAATPAAGAVINRKLERIA